MLILPDVRQPSDQIGRSIPHSQPIKSGDSHTPSNPIYFLLPSSSHATTAAASSTALRSPLASRHHGGTHSSNLTRSGRTGKVHTKLGSFTISRKARTSLALVTISLSDVSTRFLARLCAAACRLGRAVHAAPLLHIHMEENWWIKQYWRSA
ncbi:uncharacterized protein LOC110437597 [Sorghum bicolor]|uniref:Uncharacterized protein n=1 Tax=Sorghum bicolor TaxID=4558 RepID=A0A1B6PD14_SORBI|nr:uncharacterized protein LOC110437597 [Sorghum bicolor]KXG23527.1 hypothetical protein SORBI_3008G106400 [Sorghum bicolor]|eukprot:XP_021321750.1 uncharacterized protein LOC110437597 [Sorghum bicolor]